MPLYSGSSVQKKQYKAEKINPHPPAINGQLNDVVWKKAHGCGDFVQISPYEGQSPSQETNFQIMYDNDNLYIAVEAHDDEPGKIVRRMCRRDNLDGDMVTVQIDSYSDFRTAFCFSVNAAGVKGDEIIFSDGDNRDNNWDPIWYVKAVVNEQGWVAEMRIPLSQLRFGKQKEQLWGLQVSRLLYRKDECSSWQYIPRDASGLVSNFGKLKGLTSLSPNRQIELMPYFVGKIQRFETEQGNPFATGQLSNVVGGLDGKIGITNDLTLDFTINPDFGQVEADPSEVNLTAFESYFQEKRPFFIEGGNILSFPLMTGDGDFSQDNLFYTRRIGRRPQHSPETTEDEHMDVPENTTILSACKLTGKTKNGLSIGIIDSVTSAEHATIGYPGYYRDEAVEPLTNYLGLRLQKDYNGGSTVFGGMMTAVNRKLADTGLGFLHKSAYSGGFDIFHTWKSKKYTLSFSTVFSHVKGTAEAILETQQSPLRYYQRPDAAHVTLDPTRTSLTGHGGNFNFGKLGKGHFRYLAGLTWRSPGLELNDMGYMRQADLAMGFIWIGYRYLKPFAIFRRINVNANQWGGFDFSGQRNFAGGNINVSTQLKNYYSFNISVNMQGDALSKSMLRGGPSLRIPGGISYYTSLSTDSRKNLRFNIGGSIFTGKVDNRNSKSLFFGATYRPSDALSFSVAPTISIYDSRLQYVDTVDYNGENRYLLAAINQKTVGITLRMNFSITPDLSIQFYGQPFISAGKYGNFKQVTDPRAHMFNDRYSLFAADEISYDGAANEYRVDENRDGATDYRVNNPNFNFLQFQANLVVRWEFKPGSSVYVVWSQGRTGYFEESGNFALAHDMQQLFDVHPHNVFLIKFSHRFGL
jgi:hypothetical protein